MGPTFKALAPCLASVRRPCFIQSDFVRRSFIAQPYTSVLTMGNPRGMFHSIHRCMEHGFARRGLCSGWCYRNRRGSGSWHPGPTLMVRPFEEFSLRDKRMAVSIRRLAPALLHFSTFNWFLGGLALIAAAIWFAQ